MKPIFNLLLMLVVSILATWAKGILFENIIYQFSYALGMAIVSFAFPLLIMIIGFILEWFDNPKWTLIIVISWVVLLLLIFVSILGTAKA